MDNATGEQRLVFQKQNRANGGIEYRINFGRQKVAVLQQSGVGHFYINLYDNRPKFKGRLLFGYDEAEELIKIITEMGMLKPTFENAPEPTRAVELVPQNVERPPPPYYFAQPLSGPLGESNEGENRQKNVPIKKRKVAETVTQAQENVIPQDFLDFLSQQY